MHFPLLVQHFKVGYLNATETEHSPPSTGFILITDYGHVALQSVTARVQGQQEQEYGVCHQALLTDLALL